MLDSTSYPSGFDVRDGQFKDLIKAGIIDPAKVTRSALESAVSIATLLMTTHVIITDERPDK
jgi:chaperonin GroEL